MLGLLFLAGCDSGFFVDPPETGTVSLELRIPTGSLGVQTGQDSGAAAEGVASSVSASSPAAVGAARAFQRVDRVAVRVTVGTRSLLDEVVAADPSGSEIVLTFQLELEEVRAGAQVAVDLRAGDQVLFGGEGSAELERGRTARADVGLSPIPAGIRTSDPPAPIDALGDTLQFDGAVVFATGDTIPGLTVQWRSLTPGVVTVTPQGLAVAVSEGEATIEAFFQGFTERIPVRVAPVVAQVEVTPGQAEVEPGATAQFQAEARDRRGNVLGGRSVEWRSSDPAIAAVDQAGRVETFRSGQVEIIAESGEGEGRAELVVLQVPPTLTTRAAQGVDVDRATLLADVNPRGSDVEVRFRWGTDSALEGGEVTEAISLPAGLEAVRVETGLDGLAPVTTFFYRVEATTSAGTFTGNIRQFTTLNPIPAPTGLQGDFGEGIVILNWDFDLGRFTEPVFEVDRQIQGASERIIIGTSSATRFLDLDPIPAGTSLYRVRACVEGICSPWSQPAAVEIPPAEDARVEGLVLLDGEPVSGIQVRLSGRPLQEPRTTQTNPGGEYAFNGVGAGEYVVELIPGSVEMGDDWFPIRRVEISVFGFGETIRVNFSGTQPPSMPQDLTLYWFGEMMLSWTPPGGPPAPERFDVERAVVEEGGPGDFAPVAALPPTTTTLADPAPGGEYWAYRVRACRENTACSPYTAPDSTWSPETAIFGVATGVDEEPVGDGVSIEIFRYPEGGFNGSGQLDFTVPGGGLGQQPLPLGHFKYTDRSGGSILPAPGDSAYFRISGFDEETRSGAVVDSVLVAHGDLVRVDLEFEILFFPSTVEGTVRLEGDGLEEVEVRLFAIGSEVPITVRTNQDGDYSFPDVEPGDYLVEVVPNSADLSDDLFAVRQREITVDGSGEPVRADFDGFFPPNMPQNLAVYWFGEMQVSWTDSGQGPEVSYYEVQRASLEEDQDPTNGQFESVGGQIPASTTTLVDDAPEGTFWAYRVRACRVVESETYCSAYSPWDATWSAITAIYGVVTGVEGEPAQEAVFIEIFRYPEGGFNGSGESDSTVPGGDVGQQPLPPGHYKYTDRSLGSILPDVGEGAYFRISGFDDLSGASVEVDSVRVEYGESVRVDLQLEAPPLPSTVQGTVSVEGDAFFNAEIRLVDEFGFPRVTTTDEGGGYSFLEVGPGEYTVEFVPDTMVFQGPQFVESEVPITVDGSGEPIVVDFDGFFPPNMPQNLAVYWFGEMQVSWTDSGQGQEVSYYEVQRAPVEEDQDPTDGSFESVGGQIPAPTTLLEDDAPAGSFWAYRVRACRVEDSTAYCSGYSSWDSTWSPVTAIYGVVTFGSGEPLAIGAGVDVWQVSSSEGGDVVDDDSALIGGDPQRGQKALPPGHYKYWDLPSDSLLPGSGDGTRYFDILSDEVGAAADAVAVQHGSRVRVDLAGG